MIEVFPNLFVGSGADLIHVDDGNKGIKDGWFVISAAKEPFHREALKYTGRAAPKEHPEYLMARRGNRLILNLVDVDDPAYIRKEIVDVALADITSELGKGNKVLVHCNQGGSRGPGIALAWMHKNAPSYAGLTLEEAEANFRPIYPDYAPAAGIRGYLAQHWDQA